MKTTCGIFLIDKNKKILILHPTNHGAKQWSIPKGVVDDTDYNDFHTAKRELWEETGIDIDNLKYKMADIGTTVYNHRNKRLHGFLCYVDDVIEQEPICMSMVDATKGNLQTCWKKYDEDPNCTEFPEVDEFKWATIEEAYELMHYTQTRLLKEAIETTFTFLKP